MLLALLGLEERLLGVGLGEAAADGAGLLGPEVERQVLLGLVKDAELCSLLGVDDGQDAGDGFPEVVAICYVSLSSCFVSIAPRFGDVVALAARGQAPYILFSLVPDDTIFWIRSWPSSVLRSASCFARSSLFFDHSGPALTLFEEDYDIC